MTTTNKWMAQRTGVRLAVFALMVTLMPSCSPAKRAAANGPLNGAAATEQKAGENLCDRTVKCYIEKSLFINEGGSEREDNTAVKLTLNPADKKLTVMIMETKKEEAQELRLVSCSLTVGMQGGEALYEVVESKLEENGNTVVQRVNLKVVAVKGIVTLSMFAEGKPGGMKATATQWEVAN